DHALGHMDLIIGLRVHEYEMVAIAIKIGVGALVDEGALEAVGRLVALVYFHSIRDTAHLQLGDRRSLAGMDVLRRQHDIKLAVLLDDVAFADIARDNRNHLQSSNLGWRRIAGEQSAAKRPGSHPCLGGPGTDTPTGGLRSLSGGGSGAICV